LRDPQRVGTRPHEPAGGLERAHRFERDVLELVRHDVRSRAELADRAQIVIRCDDLLVCDLTARRIR
jgi:hypothetical protein